MNSAVQIPWRMRFLASSLSIVSLRADSCLSRGENSRRICPKLTLRCRFRKTRGWMEERDRAGDQRSQVGSVARNAESDEEREDEMQERQLVPAGDAADCEQAPREPKSLNRSLIRRNHLSLATPSIRRLRITENITLRSLKLCRNLS